ncbi:MAG: hypothetical protein MH472_12035, partial [Bacteroidia bacterium]|nr:hypothetical protein [Bacteroidia bacterium]
LFRSIKLMSIVSLVIAPYIAVEGGMKADQAMKLYGEMNAAAMHQSHGACSDDMSTCDWNKCKSMTKDECAAYCDSIGCSPEEKEACMSMYGADGKFDEAKCKEMCKTEKKGCCSDEKSSDECKH